MPSGFKGKCLRKNAKLPLSESARLKPAGGEKRETVFVPPFSVKEETAGLSWQSGEAFCGVWQDAAVAMKVQVPKVKI